jgi:hypothetical protein
VAVGAASPPTSPAYRAYLSRFSRVSLSDAFVIISIGFGDCGLLPSLSPVRRAWPPPPRARRVAPIPRLSAPYRHAAAVPGSRRGGAGRRGKGLRRYRSAFKRGGRDKIAEGDCNDID